MFIIIPSVFDLVYPLFLFEPHSDNMCFTHGVPGFTDEGYEGLVGSLTPFHPSTLRTKKCLHEEFTYTCEDPSDVCLGLTEKISWSLWPSYTSMTNGPPKRCWDFPFLNLRGVYGRKGESLGRGTNLSNQKCLKCYRYVIFVKLRRSLLNEKGPEFWVLVEEGTWEDLPETLVYQLLDFLFFS